MSAEEFNDLWMVCYDSAECGYAILSGSEMIRLDRENWLKERMATRLILATATSESEARERLNAIRQNRCTEAVAA